MTNHNHTTAITQLLPHAEARQEILRLLVIAWPQYRKLYQECRHAISFACQALQANPSSPPPHAITPPLPPDPEAMNNSRAEWAAAALREFQSVTGADFEDALADLLCDALHWCDRHAADFDGELARARGHYEAETAENPVPEDVPEIPPSPPIPESGEIAAKTYRAEFFTAADYAVRNFEADTPEQALELARRFYDEDTGELDFRSYDDNATVERIQIWGGERGTLAAWESDDCHLRKAAPELPKQSIRVLAMLPHYGIYNESGTPELRAAVFQAMGIEHDKYDERGFEAAILRAKNGGHHAS